MLISYSVFFNFNQMVLSTDPDLKGSIPRALIPSYKGDDNLVLSGFEKSIEVRSLTFNFENNSDFSICNIIVLDPNKKECKISVPRVVSGKVTSDSVLLPVSAYSPNYLFDSRFEYALASNKQSKNVNLYFEFHQVQRIESIRLWNGYQRSENHCYSNSRAKTLRLTGDNAYFAI